MRPTYIYCFYPKENFNDRKIALGIPEILYNVIDSRPRVARITAAGTRLLLSLANDFGLKDSHLNYDRAMPLDGLLPRHR